VLGRDTIISQCRGAAQKCLRGVSEANFNALFCKRLACATLHDCSSCHKTWPAKGDAGRLGDQGREGKTMKAITLALIAACVMPQGAYAESTVPAALVIGYDNEGKVDTDFKACLAYVRDVAEWDKAATEGGAKQVCAARKRHADAYAALQSNYKAFVEAFSKDRRLNLPDAVANLKTLVKACMDHKFGITTGGHNIMIDVIENDISASCLSFGSNLIKDETARFIKAQTQGGFVP
jgi:hypothetical protein